MAAKFHAYLDGNKCQLCFPWWRAVGEFPYWFWTLKKRKIQCKLYGQQFGYFTDNDHTIFSSQWSQQNTLEHQNPASDGRSLSPIFTLLTVYLGSRSVWVTPINYFRSALALTGNRDSTVGLASLLRTRRPRNSCLIHISELQFPSSQLPDKICGSPEPEVLHLLVKRPGIENDHSPSTDGEIENTWSYTFIPHIPSWPFLFFRGSTVLGCQGILLIEVSRSHSDTPHLVGPP